MVNVNVIPCQSIGGCSAAPVIAIYYVSNGKKCGSVGVLQGEDLPLQLSSWWLLMMPMVCNLCQLVPRADGI